MLVNETVEALLDTEGTKGVESVEVRRSAGRSFYDAIETADVLDQAEVVRAVRGAIDRVVGGMHDSNDKSQRAWYFLRDFVGGIGEARHSRGLSLDREDEFVRMLWMNITYRPDVDPKTNFGPRGSVGL